MSRFMSEAATTELQNKMLYELKLPPITYSADGKRRRPIHNRKAIQAIDVSDHYINLIGTDTTDGRPQSIQEMTEEIRYRMGLGIIAWFFAKLFISAVIQWLWDNYQPHDP